MYPVTPGAFFGPTLIAAKAEDIDGDGKADLEALEYEEVNDGSAINFSNVVVALNQGTGSFGAFHSYPIMPSGRTWQQDDLTVADLDGDCAPDLVTYGTAGVYWYSETTATERSTRLAPRRCSSWRSSSTTTFAWYSVHPTG